MKVQPPLFWSCILALALCSSSLAAHDPRQVTPLVPPGQGSATSQPPPATTATPTTTAQTTTTTTSQSPTDTSTPPTTTQTTTSQAPLTTSAPPNTPSATSTPDSPTTAVPPPTQDSSLPGSDTVFVTQTNSASQTSSGSALPTNTSKSDDDGGGGLSTGSIVGLSVAAGIAVIGIVGFFVWKFTRKRFSDFDDNEAIKWPELNSHSGNMDTHPVPARETGRAGFDTGSEADLSRVNSASNYSNTDFSAGGQDPYAVPPLPHLNPNQPYRDDPSAAATGYYDPYRGPVPGTLESGTGDWQPEAYPMTQLGGHTGRGSPAPEFMYEGGRQSPAPGAMYGRNSPVPQAPYGGRASPGPQALYGGRVSPGPQVAYAQGRASPGPHAAYDAYGPR